MKHQGIEGFTFDPPSSEWDYWEASDKANASKLARGPNGRFVRRATGNVITDCTFVPAPANQRSNPDPYRAIIWRDEPRKAPLWPFAAIAVVAAVAAAVLWGWG